MATNEEEDEVLLPQPVARAQANQKQAQPVVQDRLTKRSFSGAVWIRIQRDPGSLLAFRLWIFKRDAVFPRFVALLLAVDCF
jgi:hypothetical protein